MYAAALCRVLVERPGCGAQYALKLIDLSPEPELQRCALLEVHVPAVKLVRTILCAPAGYACSTRLHALRQHDMVVVWLQRGREELVVPLTCRVAWAQLEVLCMQRKGHCVKPLRCLFMPILEDFRGLKPVIVSALICTFSEAFQPALRKHAHAQAQMMLECRHPHIIDCIRAFQHDGQLHIVMELAQHGDLSSLLRWGISPISCNAIGGPASISSHVGFSGSSIMVIALRWGREGIGTFCERRCTCPQGFASPCGEAG